MVLPFNISYVTDGCYGQSLPKWWHLHFAILHCPPFKSHQVMLGSFWQKFSTAGHFQTSVRFCHGDTITFDESKSCSYLKVGQRWGLLSCVEHHPFLRTCVATIRGILQGRQSIMLICILVHLPSCAYNTYTWYICLLVWFLFPFLLIKSQKSKVETNWKHQVFHYIHVMPPFSLLHLKFFSQ